MGGGASADSIATSETTTYSGTEKRDVRYNIVGEKIVLLPKPNWSGNLRLNYIPTFADLVNDNDTVDSIHYWTEWVINDVAVKLCLSEETDPKPFMVERDRQQLRLTDKRQYGP